MLPPVHPFYLGLWLVAVPVLIHLINMFRHQPVQWAAMEFLLASQKKFRTWVILKQLLLLLLRMAAIALIVLALAQPMLPERFGGFLGGRPTHHVVLLDDSYSMSDRRGERSPSTRPKTRCSAWAIRCSVPASRSRSRCCGFRALAHTAAGCGPISTRNGSIPAFPTGSGRCSSRPTLRTAPGTFANRRRAAPALQPEILQQLLGPDEGERRVIYIVSDFRARQWDKPDDLKQRLMQIDTPNTEIRLVDCVEDAGHPNLAITALEPEDGIRA